MTDTIEKYCRNKILLTCVFGMREELLRSSRCMTPFQLSLNVLALHCFIRFSCFTTNCLWPFVLKSHEWIFSIIVEKASSFLSLLLKMVRETENEGHCQAHFQIPYLNDAGYYGSSKLEKCGLFTIPLTV